MIVVNVDSRGQWRPRLILKGARLAANQRGTSTAANLAQSPARPGGRTLWQLRYRASRIAPTRANFGRSDSLHLVT